MAATKRVDGKASRIVKRLFAERATFDAKRGKFSPLPWVYRRIQWHFSPRTWQVLTYLLMRSGPEGVSWFNDKQIAIDLGVGPRKIAPHLKALSEESFIAIAEDDGVRYICVLDPEIAISTLIETGKISGTRLIALQDDLETMGKSALSRLSPMTEAIL